METNTSVNAGVIEAILRLRDTFGSPPFGSPDPFVALVRYWDQNAGALMGKTADGKFWVLNITRCLMDPWARDQVIKQIAESDRAEPNGPVTLWIKQEPGQIGLARAKNTAFSLAGHVVKFDIPVGGTWLPGLIAQHEKGNLDILRWDEWDMDDSCLNAMASAFGKLVNQTGGEIV